MRVSKWQGYAQEEAREQRQYIINVQGFDYMSELYLQLGNISS